MAGCSCEIEIKNNKERKILIILFAINGFMFFIELISGWLADSSGLMADSLDMLADSLVYAIALFAVGKSIREKARSAFLNGFFQLVLGIGVFIDVIRRLFMGSQPESVIMIYISVAALIANLFCFYLLSKNQNGDIHMRATWICTRNDAIANSGVILAGAIVYFSGSSLPDLIIGSLISLIVVKGAIQILDEARKSTLKKEELPHCH